MSEKKITLSNIELVKLFGANNKKLDKIRSLFPQLKIIARGENLKLIGSIAQIKYFEQKLTAFIKHINQYNTLTISHIERLFEGDEKEILKTKDDVILHGQNGKVIKARTRKNVSIIKYLINLKVKEFSFHNVLFVIFNLAILTCLVLGSFLKEM